MPQLKLTDFICFCIRRIVSFYHLLHIIVDKNEKKLFTKIFKCNFIKIKKIFFRT